MGIVLAVSFVLLTITFVLQYWFCCCREDIGAVKRGQNPSGGRPVPDESTFNYSRGPAGMSPGGYTPRGGPK